MKQTELPGHYFWAKKLDKAACITSDIPGDYRTLCGSYNVFLGNNYADGLPVCPKCLSVLLKFNIESFELSDDIIEVMCEKYEIVVPVTIPRDKFELFLKTHDLLNWELNSSDHRGEHVQKIGTMTMEEYWASDMSYIYNDLYEYITTYPITYQGQLRENSSDSIYKAILSQKNLRR